MAEATEGEVTVAAAFMVVEEGTVEAEEGVVTDVVRRLFTRKSIRCSLPSTTYIQVGNNLASRRENGELEVSRFHCGQKYLHYSGCAVVTCNTCVA